MISTTTAKIGVGCIICTIILIVAVFVSIQITHAGELNTSGPRLSSIPAQPDVDDMKKALPDDYPYAGVPGATRPVKKPPPTEFPPKPPSYEVWLTNIKSHFKHQVKGPLIAEAPADYFESEDLRLYACKVIDEYLEEVGLEEELEDYRPSIVDIFQICLYNKKSHALGASMFATGLDEKFPMTTALGRMCSVSLCRFKLNYFPAAQLFLLFPCLLNLHVNRTGLGNNYDRVNILTSLVYLAMTGNGMTKVPDFSDMHSLEDVTLAHNDLHGIISFGKIRLKHLYSLRIEGNPRISEILNLEDGMPCLRDLYVDKCHEDAAQEWVQGYKEHNPRVRADVKEVFKFV